MFGGSRASGLRRSCDVGVACRTRRVRSRAGRHRDNHRGIIFPVSMLRGATNAVLRGAVGVTIAVLMSATAL